MKPQKVNPVEYITDSAYDNVGEGLRILARMIVRRLMSRKPGVNGPHPRLILQSGKVDQKANSTVPEGLDDKPASPQSDSRMLDAGYSGGKGGGGE